MTYTIRRCRANVEAWCLDTGTDVLGPSSHSLDGLVQILAGYEPNALAVITIVIDREAEHAAARAKLEREDRSLALEAMKISGRRRRLRSILSPSPQEEHDRLEAEGWESEDD